MQHDFILLDRSGSWFNVAGKRAAYGQATASAATMNWSEEEKTEAAKQ